MLKLVQYNNALPKNNHLTSWLKFMVHTMCRKKLTDFVFSANAEEYAEGIDGVVAEDVVVVANGSWRG